MYKDAFETTFYNEKSYWWYIARLAILDNIFNLYNDFKNSLKILNLGCGTGMISEHFSKYGKVISADLSEEALKFAKFRGIKDMVCSDATVLCFKNNFFNVVMAYDILEHIENDATTLLEIKRILCKGGKLILTVPAYNWMWSNMDKIACHKRRYTKRMLCAKLKNIGLNPIKSSYFNTFLFSLAIIRKLYNQIFKKDNTNFLGNIPPLLNSLFTRIFKLEAILLVKTNFNFGLSLLFVAEKS